ncbi:MAG TPA: SUMF1/EgtB/PvdO family nonheme iron enzyme [Chitinophagaceae bacterium]|nr:SUMF1/EgtB/PvdO family nonheme iron enzyme [Chitinophagaceae bacterium]HNA92118.1 SUMF1/EgtB/PvdO family nonheme iron enzyme [Chitinophagaceae bacterium]HNF38831.1 SUMF1/EgtB/PvdO family nonheme iron enzyme [Chitinophagaceae bacterium]HNF46340.1 SUMF1/EgtB/PvdO family nonheme iron enzyme [Chitinophagaceae bacterium]HNJ26200.1 SUMF1/EgtB/PvdO family nonheme iron enzyme [Chitinophagaceae bacterium]
MQKTVTVKNLAILMSCVVLLASCKGKGLFGKKKQDKSDMTGWNYNDKNMGGYKVSKAVDQKTGPGLVFVQGGTFTMGQTEEDVMGDWNNIPRRVSVPSFYIDRTEVANVHYREYLHWIEKVFDPTADENNRKIYEAALPDTLSWRSELSYNEPMVEYYFRHPGFNNYPVVGVTWRQASDFCLWRSDRVNEKNLMDKGFINKSYLKPGAQQGSNHFSTKAYLLNLDPPPPGKIKTKKGEQKQTTASIESGIIMPDYRLPFEAEWEYAAYGLIDQNPRPSVKEGKRGEELASNKQMYPWSQNVNGLRDTRHGSWQGAFLANFKRGNGDNAGVAGGLNDRAFYTADVKSFYPNAFGLYNMAGNVSEWVQDVYRPLSTLDFDDMPAPFRGNKYQKLYKNANGEYEKNDTTGKVKMVDVTDAESKNRRNYQRGNVINFADGDSLSQSSYGYGVTTLISDKSRVYKGGSWNDRPYWLSPGSRRFLEEEQALSTLGFRCAMDRMGSPEGNGRKTGQQFPTRRQNSKTGKTKKSKR